MIRKLMLNDCKQNKLITTLLFDFITVAATLFCCAFGMFVQLSASTKAMMKDAKTPDFMQMHSGSIDMERLEAFAQENEKIASFQVQGFLNLEGDSFCFQNRTLADSMMDNGVCTQGGDFDYLLSYDGEVLKVNEGEVYVPDTYLKEYAISVGDIITIAGIPLKVCGAVCDSQMNASLASSKRFLISENDYAKMLPYGTEEYLIEFRGYAREDAGAIEQSYTQAGLEANGPAITYPLFQMINAIADGMLVAMILFISVIIILISHLCIRFTLLSRLNEDYREIGIMKATGLTFREIRESYLAKYRLIASVGCVLGFALSFVVRRVFLNSIMIYQGKENSLMLVSVMALLGAILLYVWIVSYTKGILRRIRKISAAAALRGEADNEKVRQMKGFRLSQNTWINSNVYLGLKDMANHPKLYFTMLFVIILAVFIALVPQNIYQTISSESFIRFMGVGKCDIRMDLQQHSDMEQKADEVEAYLKEDDEIQTWQKYVTATYHMKTSDGQIENIKIETGDYEYFPIDYVEGACPKEENEIALSTLIAQELGKSIGDSIPIEINGTFVDMLICGIYSDITNGGKTAKAVFTQSSEEVMWYVFCISYDKDTNLGSKTAEIKEHFDFAKVALVQDYITQTMGGTIDNMKKISLIAILLAIVTSILITSLFMKMLTVKDRYPIALMRAVGFKQKEITLQYLSRAIAIVVLAIIMGTLLANTLGVGIAGMAIAKLGVAHFSFTIKPLIVYLLYPCIMLLSVCLAALFGTQGAGKICIMDYIKE